MRGWAALAIWMATPAMALAAGAPERQAYAVAAPHSAADKAPMGWGAFAIDKGRSLDLTDRSLDWAADPSAARNDVAVGVGWRSDGVQALVGYEHRDAGPKYDPRRPALQDPAPWHGSGVMGVSLSFRR